MATNRFKRAKKEEEIKEIFSSNIEEREASLSIDERVTEITEVIKEENLKEDLKVNEDVKIEKISTKLASQETVKMDKLGVSIKESSKKRLDKLSKELKRKPNSVVTLLLDNLYDEEKKSFKVDINKKESNKITSYHMKKSHIDAINKLSKKTGYNKSEIFNILLNIALTIEEE